MLKCLLKWLHRWISQQPMVIEQLFNFLDTLSRTNETLPGLTIPLYQNIIAELKKVLAIINGPACLGSRRSHHSGCMVVSRSHTQYIRNINGSHISYESERMLTRTCVVTTHCCVQFTRHTTPSVQNVEWTLKCLPTTGGSRGGRLWRMRARVGVRRAAHTLQHNR